jgi:NAD(P)-dependent dehydrogenase (short-subunit alcohol dehydrogenase family)
VTGLDGRGAVVTGGAGGIGGAVALALAGAGAKVAVLDREAASPGGFPTFACDLTVAEEVKGAMARAVDALGRLDIVFNGAGISGRRLGDGPVDRCTEEGWDTVLATNLKSVFLVCREAIPSLRAAGGGSIINLSSVLALVGGDRDFATHAYAASKGGIVSLTRAMAVTYASEHIRVNAICPGLGATPMSRRAQEDPVIRRRLPELQPLAGDFLAPEDVAQAALFLAGDGSRHVTGLAMTVDGGWTAS